MMMLFSIRSLLRSALLAASILIVQVLGQDGTFPVCEVCGEGLRVTALDVMITIPTQEPLDCATIEMGGLNGMIEAQFCALIATFLGPCECAPIAVAPTAPSSMDGGSIMPSDMPSDAPMAMMMGDMSDVPSDMPSLMPNSSGSPSMMESMDPVAAPPTTAPVPTTMPIVVDMPTEAPSGAATTTTSAVTTAAMLLLVVVGPQMAFLV